MSSFKAYVINHDRIAFDILDSPVGRIHVESYWNDAAVVTVPAHGSAIVLPTQRTLVQWPGVHADVGVGCFAQVPGGTIVDGAGLMIHTPGYFGLAQIGGPTEDVGRLRYIDGCSDSLLVCPAKLGDPCLNLLHLPPGIHQTAHTHPSERIGIILRGHGYCRTDEGYHELLPGMFWHIPPEFVHSFHTDGDSLDVFAWHPDSDFGPSHDWHPMLNRTIVEGVPVSDPKHAAIRTK